jgi:hypothetical protein
MHEEVQIWLPPEPQLCVVPGTHAPAGHGDQSDQMPLWHVRVCVPQPLLQDCDDGPSQDVFVEGGGGAGDGVLDVSQMSVRYWIPAV